MSRKHIYYWKSDRPSAFGTLRGDHSDESMRLVSELLYKELKQHFQPPIENIQPGPGQGNHVTFTADWQHRKLFIRLEDGPEKDDYMLAEAKVLELIRQQGVPTVQLHRTDASREHVRFAYQVMDFLNGADLNSLYKSKQIDLRTMAYRIGVFIAKWQEIRPEGFGPFKTSEIRENGKLVGWHGDYTSYYFLNLTKHLTFLTANSFLTASQADDIECVIDAHRKCLHIENGCLVHKDLALWNILGTPEDISAFIDWDDAISGDPTDDLSLLACFHDEATVRAAINGYNSIRPLPRHFEVRFQMHLLRNMITKAVIRVGGNYFQKKDDFFLIDAGGEGSSLEKVTRDKILGAMESLRNRQPQPFL